MKRILLTLTALVLLAGTGAFAQFGPQRDPSAPFDLKTDAWNARWISVPGTGAQDYGVYYFRKDVDLAAMPADYVVHVTGDNRYKLYVNGHLVSLGPAKGDATHWNYETVDLVPWLKPGTNVIAALVYHEGDQKPDSQVSVAAGFLLQGEGNARSLYTDRSWKCLSDKAYSPLRVSVSGYYVAGPGEQVDMKSTVKDWNTAAVNTESWLEPVQGPAGEPKDFNSSNQGEGHNLRPSTLPQMELKAQNLASVRKAEGVRVPAGFLEGKVALTVPANTKAELLLDQGFLTNAYFNLAFSGGRDARLTVGYAESLFVPAPAREMSEEELARIPAEFRRMARMPRTAGKGNRNDVDGKIFQGREDVLISDGSRGQAFTTLSWRTYRYVRLQVETAGEPLTIDRLDGTFTGYPFTLDARLDTDNAEMQKMLEIGWRRNWFPTNSPAAWAASGPPWTAMSCPTTSTRCTRRATTTMSTC